MNLLKIFKKKVKTKEVVKDFIFDEKILSEIKTEDLSSFGITTDWRNITLEFYLKYINYTTAMKFYKEISVEERGLRLLAFLENKKYEDIKSLPVFLLSTIQTKWEFLSQQTNGISFQEPFIEIEGKIYFIQKNFELLSFEQYQNQTEYLKESEEDKNYHKNLAILLAISCIPREQYKLETAQSLSNKILKTDMYSLIPAINFFLSKENYYIKDIHTCLKEVQEMKLKELEAILNKLEISITHGVGTQHYTIWQMKILQNLIKSYLYLYKTYLSI